jgi:hypothetical protein
LLDVPDVPLAALVEEAALEALVSSATAVLVVLVSAALVPPLELVLDVELLTKTSTSISELLLDPPEDCAWCW